MSTFELHEDQWLPITVDEAWRFFSSPYNLAKITPPDLDFVIISESLAPEIFPGMLINYYLKPLFGVKVKWQTTITGVKKPFEFTDVQTRGPYKLWEHHHQFIKQDGGTLVNDKVRYALPFGVIGLIAHSLFVKERLRKIFSFRKQALEQIFPHTRTLKTHS